MAEKCTWITFSAHPTKFMKEEDHHPDFFGVFVCPDSRRDPEELLGELLSNRHLLLVEIGRTQLKNTAADWGINEQLKPQMEEYGYALSMIKLNRRKIPFD